MISTDSYPVPESRAESSAGEAAAYIHRNSALPLTSVLAVVVDVVVVVVIIVNTTTGN